MSSFVENNGKIKNSHGFFYNVNYVCITSGTWKGETVEQIFIMKMSESNAITYITKIDSNMSEGDSFSHISGIGDIVDASNTSKLLAVDHITYNTPYSGIDSGMGLPVTLVFDSAGDLNMTYNIPNSIVSIDSSQRKIIIGGSIQSTYSADGKTINLLGNTYTADI